MTGLTFAEDPSGSYVCNRRQQGWEQTHQPEGLAKIQVRDDGLLDQSSTVEVVESTQMLLLFMLL